MEYLHIKNLEKYHPKYKDRSLIWCKAFFSMLNSDPEFEMLCEIDKWRFIAFVMLELQLKKEIPIDEPYLTRKGFDFKKRPISLTLQMLHTLVEVRNESVTQSRVDKEKNKKESVVTQQFSFEEIYLKYPNRVGKKEALKHFEATVKTEQDFLDIQTALKNYLLSDRVKKGFVQNASTWFNDWKSWVSVGEKVKEYLPADKDCKACKGQGKLLNGEGAIIRCACVKEKIGGIK
jgi:hypothetical protein